MQPVEAVSNPAQQFQRSPFEACQASATAATACQRTEDAPGLSEKNQQAPGATTAYPVIQMSPSHSAERVLGTTSVFVCLLEPQLRSYS